LSSSLRIGHPADQCPIGASGTRLPSNAVWAAPIATPDKKASYKKGVQVKRKPLFSLTMAEFVNAPVVDEVDFSNYNGVAGDSIVVNTL
jgi:hypothetical protein